MTGFTYIDLGWEGSMEELKKPGMSGAITFENPGNNIKTSKARITKELNNLGYAFSIEDDDAYYHPRRDVTIINVRDITKRCNC